MATFFAPEGTVSVNDGPPTKGRAAIARGVVGAFRAEFPDLVVTCDLARPADSRGVFLWTLEGAHTGTGNRVVASGRESWLLDDGMQLLSREGHFDGAACQAQVDGG